MKIKISDLNINYVSYINEDNKKNIILLHGWGSNLNIFNFIISSLKDNYNVYAIDLPGFGESDMPNNPLWINDYSLIIKKFIEYFNIDNPILIGHSFGGRIIIKLLSKFKLDVNKIVLIDSAGIRPKRTIKYYFKIYLYKFLKLFKHILGIKYLNYIRKLFGSSDYNMVNDVLKKTLINTVNEDLKKDLSNIDKETLIVWGENDNITPVKDAKVINKLVVNSGLVILKNAGHYSFLDKPYDCIKIINYFIEN
jgi:pimeloyl-ACP methyl ester carboxylesterase